MITKELIIEPITLGYQVTFNRPAQRNALTLNMLDALMWLLDRIEQDEKCRLLILRGAGDHFCAGGDLSDLLNAAKAYEQGDTQAFYAINRRFGELLLRLSRLPAIVISLVQGAVMGGGLGIAAVSDLVIAQPSACFAMPEVSLGLPPAQIAPFVSARIGTIKARQLALLGQKVDANLAQTLGLADRLVHTDEETNAQLDQFCTSIQQASPAALRSTKKLFFQQSPLSPQQWEANLDAAAEAFSFAITQGDGPEGSRAFLQKRKPQWAQTQ